MTSSTSPLHVAIIGGGLCGLSLAIALNKRCISYTIYEARGSFTEIGAGISLAPNTIEAFDIIDSGISEKIYGIATRNEAGKEDVWMTVRLGVQTENYVEGQWVTEIKAPPTGMMSVSRNELLQLLASPLPTQNAKFDKKLVALEQSTDHVTLSFEDGTQDVASLVIGCDGVHSSVRRLLLGPDHPAITPRYSHAGVYRAVVPIHVFEEIVGVEKAHMTTVWPGPGGYLIYYPIDGRTNVNVGFWTRKPDEWLSEGWVLPNRKAQLLEDFGHWGSTVRNLVAIMADDTSFWAGFHHAVHPESHFRGRICVIGDAAHAMCPHQGQGATQSMEDACVLAEVLQAVNDLEPTSPSSATIEAALSAYQSVRKPRAEKISRLSLTGYDMWGDLYRQDLTSQDADDFRQYVQRRLGWVWNADIAGQGEKALAEMRKRLGSNTASDRIPHTKL